MNFEDIVNDQKAKNNRTLLQEYARFAATANDRTESMSVPVDVPYIEMLPVGPYRPPLAYSHCGYIKRAIESVERDAAVRIACADMLDKRRFDTIAVSGVSGLIFGPILAYRMHKELLVVRKSDDIHNHSRQIVEGFVASRQYIIVDDQVALGSTVRRMQDEIHIATPLAQCVGIYVYGCNEWRDKFIKPY